MKWRYFKLSFNRNFVRFNYFLILSGLLNNFFLFAILILNNNNETYVYSD